MPPRPIAQRFLKVLPDSLVANIFLLVVVQYTSLLGLGVPVQRSGCWQYSFLDCFWSSCILGQPGPSQWPDSLQHPNSLWWPSSPWSYLPVLLCPATYLMYYCPGSASPRPYEASRINWDWDKETQLALTRSSYYILNTATSTNINKVSSHNQSSTSEGHQTIKLWLASYQGVLTTNSTASEPSVHQMLRGINNANTDEQFQFSLLCDTTSPLRLDVLI